MGSRPASFAVPLILLTAILGSGCGDDHPAGPAARNGVPGIVLLCMDTLRADGVAKKWMPGLYAFAQDATVFRDASSSSSWTAPSVATILTGLEPSHTGVRGAFTSGALAGAVTTIAEVLHDHGFSTAASTAGGWVSPLRGYGQGFDSFSTNFDSEGPAAAIASWQAARPRDKPFFLFLHTIAAHDPYGRKDRTWGPAAVLPAVAARAKAIYEETKAAGWRLPAGAAAWFFELFLYQPQERFTVGEALGAEAWDHLWTLVIEWLDNEGRGSKALAAIAAKAEPAYRDGLSYADDVFARTLAALDAAHLPPDTVIAVVGDHGEALGEHGTLLHARWLYDELTRVPLIIRAPKRLPARRVVEGSCGLVDVMPTLLAFADIPAPPRLDGRSLVALANAAEKGHPIFGEEERRRPGTGDAMSVRVVSTRTGAAKALVTFDLATNAIFSTELYDLVADPGELTSLPAGDVPRFGPEFCAAAKALYARIPGAPSPPFACK